MNSFPYNNFQRSFFKELEEHFTKRGEMINALSETLNVGKDAVYRRLRGDTVLSADELILLARKYDVRLDLQQDAPSSTNFSTTLFEITSEVEYFQEIEEGINFISKIEGITMDYATPELPLFYILFTPTILAFKTYVYGLTSWDFAKWKGVEFRPELIDPEVFEIAKRTLKPLCNLPGRELWSIGILDVTLREIEHAVDIGRLVDGELIKRMFSEIEEIIDHMEAMTEAGKRFLPGTQPTETSPDFCVYHNEMTNTNNVVIVKSESLSLALSAFINPDYIISSDKNLLKKMETWFENLVESSDVLIANSGKYKERYFNKLRRSLATAEQRIKGKMADVLDQ